MGVYIEITCDKCSTERGHSTYIAAPTETIDHEFGMLTYVAVSDGWGFNTTKGWLCPHCLTVDTMPRDENGFIVGESVRTAVFSNVPKPA